jgi:hypothetical protein
MKLFNVIQHERGTTEGGYPLFEWKSFVSDTIYALGLLADKWEAISIRNGRQHVAVPKQRNLALLYYFIYM